jgi:enterochelin esterase-like enzyme
VAREPELTLRVREIGRAGARAPLLVVLDGPDYVRRASLLPILRRIVEAREAPPHRVALVAALDDLVGRRVRRVGLGSTV